MYQAFASTNPLPKDRSLIDYGFEDYESVAVNPATDAAKNNYEAVGASADAQLSDINQINNGNINGGTKPANLYSKISAQSS